MKRTAVIFGSLIFLLAPAIALADEEQACPEGEVQVAFADGNTVSTVCVTEGSGMEATVADTSTEGVTDAGNYD